MLPAGGESLSTSMRRILPRFTLGFWAGLAIFARSYMAPYNTVAGQLALGVIVAGFGFTLTWFARLSWPVVGARFLQDLNDPPAGSPISAAVPR